MLFERLICDNNQFKSYSWEKRKDICVDIPSTIKKPPCPSSRYYYEFSQYSDSTNTNVRGEWYCVYIPTPIETFIKNNTEELAIFVICSALIIGIAMKVREKILRTFLMSGLIGLSFGLIAKSFGYYNFDPIYFGFGIFLLVFSAISYQKIFRD